MSRIMLIVAVGAECLATMVGAFSPNVLLTMPTLRSVGISNACLMQQPRSRVALHMSVANPEDIAKLVEEGMREKDAVMLLEQGKTLKEALFLLDTAIAREQATGSASDFFKSFVDVEGDYVDEGWVDESAPQGNAFAGLGSMFGGLFGGSKTDETKVVAAVSPSPPMVSNSQWEPLTDEASGSIYYWNKQTGETAWEMPK